MLTDQVLCDKDPCVMGVSLILFEALIGSLELLGGRLQRLGELFFGRTGERGARASALRALWVEDGGRLAGGRRVESVLNQFF